MYFCLQLKRDKLRQVDEAADKAPRRSAMELKMELLAYMKPRESVAQAMRRNSSGAKVGKQKSSAGGNVRGKGVKDTDDTKDMSSSSSAEGELCCQCILVISYVAINIPSSGISSTIDLAVDYQQLAEFPHLVVRY
jgi:hypothetical protein